MLVLWWWTVKGAALLPGGLGTHEGVSWSRPVSLHPSFCFPFGLVPVLLSRPSSAEERLDLMDEARSKWLSEAAFNLITVDGDKVGDAQARAGNTLDRIQVQAQFGGFRKTAEASEKVRDAQLEAATMQNQAQKEASEIGSRLGDYRGKIQDLANDEKWLVEQKGRLEKANVERKDAEVQIADASKKRDDAERERNAAQEDERKKREEAKKTSDEAKAARDEATRLANELKNAKRQLEQARKERDKAARAAAERAKKEGCGK